MKRSKSIGLLAMSASVIALTACEEPAVDAAVFENLSQCLADPNVERAQCEADYQAAKSQHAQVSPKYTSQQDCEADFGAEQCEAAPYQTRSGGSVFMPMMMGYMMGSMLGGRSGVASQPLYRSTDDSKNFRTADNKKVGNKIGRTQVARSSTRAPSMKSSTVSRGGFGARARSFGSVAG
ncbi:MAG: hypothetical protein CFH10_00907 [Alphaproteobacteria bacterium MarineAlpha4_Bin2]|nr:MAG: hypothetical protein CFH10_00907 [Alphaproteobacteria bacterium MarineAlpha4_Bin2]